MSFANESYLPAALIAGDHPVRTRQVTLTDISATGALVAGTVLGRVTADGKFGISLTASADGSQTPRAILAEDADPSGGDVSALVYVAADVDLNKLTLGTGHDAESVTSALEAFSIYVHDSIEAPTAP